MVEWFPDLKLTNKQRNNAYPSFYKAAHKNIFDTSPEFLQQTPLCHTLSHHSVTMKQQVLVCFLVVVLVSLVNGLAIDLSKSIQDVETLLDNLRSLDTNMKRDKVGLKTTLWDYRYLFKISLVLISMTHVISLALRWCQFMVPYYVVPCSILDI